MKKLLLILVVLILPISSYGYNYQLWNRQFRYFDIPEYRMDAYKTMGIPFYTMIKLEATSQIECGREDGMCNNGNDCGPFQINKIHKDMYNKCKDIMYFYNYHKEKCNNGNLEYCPSMYTDKYLLFRDQAKWVLNRRMHYVDKYNMYEYSDRARSKRLFIIHNGNNRLSCNGREWKYCFAEKGLIVREKLIKLYYGKY